MTREMKPWLSTTLAATAAALALSACDRASESPLGMSKDGNSTVAEAPRQADRPMMEKAPPNTDAAAPASQNPSNDAAITSSVNAALARDPDLVAQRIEVDTVDGKVALRGNVANPQARERATQIAKSVAGVRSVDNQLVVGKG